VPLLSGPTLSRYLEFHQKNERRVPVFFSIAGYEHAFISLIELGKTNPSLRSIFDICGSLQMKPSTFHRQVERLAGFELPSDKRPSEGIGQR
jgi:hypothetical protein